MSKYVIDSTTLSDIGDAIRTKNGSTDLIPVVQLANEILALDASGGGGEIEALVIDVTGDASHFDYNGRLDDIISNKSNRVTFTDVTNARSLFENSKLEVFPDVDFDGVEDMAKMFKNCISMKELPNITGKMYRYNWDYYYCTLSETFYGCENLRTIPVDFFMDLGTRGNSGTDFWPFAMTILVPRNGQQWILNDMFYGCYSLRQIPNLCLFMFNQTDYKRPANNNAGTNTTTGYFLEPYYNTFRFCYSLDEIVNYPVFRNYTMDRWGTAPNNMATANGFYMFVDSCYRLKRLTFAYNSGSSTPSSASNWNMEWANQTIDLTSVGYGSKETILNYNSGITADKEVYDDATYAALKDDPDWFTQDVAYSRYNKTSAIETINSLPKTEKYAASNGINYIKFTGAAGSATDGGAINTMTEEEVAVATAKGWTVVYV
jgi:hypothetical protein